MTAHDHTVAITMGDPKGIGPEIICKALTKKNLLRRCRYIIVGFYPAFKGLPEFKTIRKNKNVSFVDIDHIKVPHQGTMGALTSGRLSVAALQVAVKMLQEGRARALVTAPISKRHVMMAGFGFPGHTEFLAHEFGIKRFAMMLFHDRLKVVLSTIHIPLRQVFSRLKPAVIVQNLELSGLALISHFGIKKPRIAVCGLNPHAGENGFLGDEERRIIIPAIRAFKRKKLSSRVEVSGPWSADTVFCRALRGEFDAVLCHYHDQGLIPLKATGFEQGVNMTLGLPFVRTSPDHGTAFDIAGKGVADCASMTAAIEVAIGL